jgi:hypothetical protein
LFQTFAGPFKSTNRCPQVRGCPAVNRGAPGGV